MLLKGKISILIDRDKTRIEIEDDNANVRFVTVTLTPEQLSAALSRQALVKCSIEVNGLEKVGKMHENKTFEFAIPKNLASSSNSKELQEVAQSNLSDGWVADSHFASQGSFFSKDGIQYARCTIRRWI